MKYSICNSLDDIEKLDFIPTIVIGFYQVGFETEVQHSFDMLKSLFPLCNVFGCSTQGNIHDTIPHIETEAKQPCVFICINMPQRAYEIRYYREDEEDILSKESTEYSAMVFSAKYHLSIETLISKLQNTLNSNHIFGAIAGRDLDNLEGGSLFFNGKFIKEGEIVWYIDQKYYLLEGISIHNFDPIGYELTITSAQENIIYEIEHRPALDVLEEIIGEISEESIASFDYPFFIHSVEEIKEVNKGKKTLFSMKGVDRENNSICLSRNISSGDKLKLAIPYTRKAQDNQLKVFQRYTQTEGLAFLFVCIAFIGHWGEVEPIYLMRLAKKIGMPFVGLHALGEIGTLENDSYVQLHNQTLTLAVLSERR